MSVDSNAVKCFVSVVALSDDDAATARALATELSLPFVGTQAGITQPADNSWQLLVSANERILRRPDGALANISFVQGQAANRQAQASKDQTLIRALGLHKLSLMKRQSLHIIDATVGLGQDGWLIACQGCRTTWLEESALLAALLQHALEQASQQSALRPITENIHLLHTRAQDYFNTQAATNADIVYLDPMFPIRKKHAKVKKGMQFLQALLPEGDNHSLLGAALGAAKKRVVVKRPSGADPIEGTDQWCGQITTIETNAIRFDIYHIAQF